MGCAMNAIWSKPGWSGGDVVRSDVLVIAVTALGDLEGRAPVTRAGAQVGDVVAFAGRLGLGRGGPCHPE